MKIAVSSYSFRKWYTAQNLNVFDIIHKAKEIGFEAIEFTNLELPPENEDIFELATKVKEEADKIGIEISGYSVAADLLCGCEGDLEKEVEKVKRSVDVAKILGVSRRTYVSYEKDESKIPPMKMEFFLHTLEKYGFIDETHGVLALDTIKQTSGKITKINNEIEEIFEQPLESNEE